MIYRSDQRANRSLLYGKSLVVSSFSVYKFVIMILSFLPFLLVLLTKDSSASYNGLSEGKIYSKPMRLFRTLQFFYCFRAALDSSRNGIP